MRWKDYYAIATRWIVSDHVYSLMMSVSAGVCFVFGLSVAIGTVGFSLWATIGLLCAAAIGLDASWRLKSVTSSRVHLLCRVGLVGWIFLAPFLASSAFQISTAMMGTLMVAPTGAFVSGLLVGLATLTLPVIASAMAVPRSTCKSLATPFGLLVGCAAVSLVPVAIGAQWLAAATVSVCSLWLVLRVLPESHSVGQTEEEGTTPSGSVPSSLFGYLGLVVAGSAIAVVARVLNQTMPSSIQTLACGIGTALSVTMLAYFVARRADRWSLALGVSGLGTSAVILLYPQIVNLQLAISASIPYPSVLFLCRGLLVSAFVLPAAIAAGWSLSMLRSKNAGIQLPAATLVVGIVATWFAMPLSGTAMLAALIAVAGGLVAIGCVRLEGAWIPKGKLRGLSVAAMLLAAVATPCGLNRFDTRLSSQLLFSTSVFRQYANGTNPDELLATDDGRCVRTVETPSGTSSVWRYAGNRIQVRNNGLPVLVTSTNSLTCPQSGSALMPIVLPILMHESVEHVLLLGDPGPAAEATSLLFPVTSVTSLNSGSRTVPEVDDAFASRFDDERFTQIQSDPNIGLAGLQGEFDIVVSRPPLPSSPLASPYYTSEFHQRVSKRLSQNGFFCQTFSQNDLGATPLKRVLQSLKSTFARVSVIQMDGPELLLVATNGDSIIRDGFTRRTNLTHVRGILADLGWDWSRVLRLASLDNEAIEAIVETSPGVNSVANAVFLWGLPLETMSWADKSSELQEQIAAFERSLLTRVPQDEYRDEAARRIKEIGQEAELLFAYPDEPWMYRKSLRTRLEQYARPPREVVVDGKIKRKAHPVDKYRKDYFSTLGRAVQRRDADAIERLAGFTSPNEPLVSYFANHEIIRLLEGTNADAATVFNHRLHTIYFVPGLTRSVREVVAAMNQLVEKPETIENPADRWDQMNSLLQVLMGRWTARRDVPPMSTHVALNDIEKSLIAIDAGIEAMHQWAEDANIDLQLCENREAYLRRQLERPLRRYRDQLMPHHYKHAEEQIADDEVVDQFRTLGN